MTDALLSLELRNDRTRSTMEQRGVAAYLMGQEKTYRAFPVACLAEWIDPPILLKQIQLFFSSDAQRAVGYLTWALLAPDVEQRWINDPTVRLHMSEWNEDGALWIMDFVAPFGHAREIIRYVRENMFLDVKCVQTIRRRPDGTLKKHNIWRR